MFSKNYEQKTLLKNCILFQFRCGLFSSLILIIILVCNFLSDNI